MRGQVGDERRNWRLEVERGEELETLLAKVAIGGKQLLKNMFMHTNVLFKRLGAPEEGEDAGGLSAELFTTFFERALSPQAGLFECDEAGKFLPKTAPSEAEASDHLARLKCVGKVMLKCLLDDYAIGQRLSLFIYGFLLDEHRPFTQPGGALDSVVIALDSLGEFAPQLAQSYRHILGWDAAYFSELSQSGMQLELTEFAPHLGQEPLSLENRELAVYEACKYRLLGCRELELRALRAGFTLQAEENASEAMRRHSLDLLPVCHHHTRHANTSLL
jgi:hypothetical protein